MPHLVILPCRVFSPVEYSEGVSPMYEASSSAFSNLDMSCKLHQDLYGGELAYPRSGTEEFYPVEVFCLTAQENDLPVDPGNLPGRYS